MNSQTGLKKETAGALAYLFGPITGFLFLLLEKDEFVRFHAMQSIVLSALSIAVLVIAGIILPILMKLFLLIFVICWLVLMYKASLGEKFEIPYLNQFTKQFVGK